MGLKGLQARLALLAFWVSLARPLTASQLSFAHRVLLVAGLSSSALAAAVFALGSCGVAGEGPLRRALGLGSRSFRIGGSVAPGWEPVRDAFRRNFELGVETAAQFCVYFKGVRVVDLFGSLDRRPSHKELGTGPFDQQNYNEDSLQLVMSSSKVLESLAIAIAVDKGLLEYDAPIVKYWPEFADVDGADKRTVTVADLMRHQAGLTYFAQPLNESDFRSGDMGDLIARSPAVFPRTTKRAYHGITRGLVVNELLRRVDPDQPSVGRYLQDLIAGPLGVASHCHIGTLPVSEDARVEPISLVSLPQVVAQVVSVTASDKLRVGRPSSAVPFTTSAVANRRLKDGGDPESFQTKFVRAIDNGVEASINKGWWRRVESPSSNCHSSARSLAKIAGCLAMRGEIEGTRIISAAGLDAALQDPEAAFDAGVNMTTHNTKAGFTDFSHQEWDDVGVDADRPPGAHATKGFFGWGGFGGSAMMFNPESGMGVAYCMAQFGNPLWCAFGMSDPRCLRILEAVRECEARLSPRSML
eukprot:TRINITY_DN23488_c0_g2_i1.p1 TRINITY_DN23488_c0_g2~~TRINITY_DN23488_c0_g2_i1.p1  ORF type:complete len:535 (+),score=72.95 TRINITY_DN23488_c0_g2_i1:23-1606(+)